MTAKRILIADDDAQFVLAIAKRCEALGIEVETASNGMDAIRSIGKHPPDLVILDINMPGGNGTGVFERMSSNPELAKIPVVFLSGAADEDAIHRCEAMGAYYVLKGPDAWDTLKPILNEILSLVEDRVAEPTGRSIAEILVVDDDPDILRVFEARLNQHGVTVRSASSGVRGFWIALRSRPDVIITDYQMAEGRGDYLLRRLKDHPLTCDIPVVVITGRGGGARDYGLEREMRNLGAVSYFSKPVDFAALWKLLQRYLPPQIDGPDSTTLMAHAGYEAIFSGSPR